MQNADSAKAGRHLALLNSGSSPSLFNTHNTYNSTPRNVILQRRSKRNLKSLGYAGAKGGDEAADLAGVGGCKCADFDQREFDSGWNG
jgi:hypothetical protein